MEREVAKFVARLRDVEVIPTIVSLRERLEAIRQAEIAQDPDPSARCLAGGARGPRRPVQRHREQDPAHARSPSCASRRGPARGAPGRRWSTSCSVWGGPRDPRSARGGAPWPWSRRTRSPTPCGPGGATVEIVPMRTEGDRLDGAPLALVGGKGLFVREIEEALLAARIDVAVHSLKDLPAELPPGLCLAALPPRADPRDVLVTRGGGRLARSRRRARWWGPRARGAGPWSWPRGPISGWSPCAATSTPGCASSRARRATR